MRAEKGGLDGHGISAGQLAGDPQHLGLVFEGKAVAGFDLDRADAFGEQRLQPRRAFIEKLLLTRGARGAHGRGDAAAAAGDFLV